MKPTFRERLRLALSGRVAGNESITSLSLDSAEKARLSQEFSQYSFSNYNFLPRRTFSSFDFNTLFAKEGSYNYAEILNLLADLDGDVSMAVWNVLCLGNSVYRALVTQVGASEKTHPQGQKAVDSFLKQINRKKGGLDALIEQWLMSAYLQGAVSGEAIFDASLKHVVDIAPVNPYTIIFRLDQEKGEVYPYQYQYQPNNSSLVQKLKTDKDFMNYVALNPATFRYIPLQSTIGDPYGRSPATPSIPDILFNMQVYYDLRQVIHNQGWPRIGVRILTDVLKSLAPASVQNDPKKLSDFIKDQIDEIKLTYNSLKPDDTLIYTNSAEISSIEGASTKGSLFDPTALLRALERRIIRDLKQHPMLMGSNEGTTETHGTVQYDIYVKGIEAFQRLIKSLMEDMLKLYLRMEGIQAEVSFQFESIQTKDRKTEAEAEAVEIANAIAKRDEGWISNDQASQEITGSDAVLEEEELQNLKDLKVALTATEPSSGANFRSLKKAPTLTRQKKKFSSLESRFKKSLYATFSQMEKELPLEKMIDEVFKLYPTNKLDKSSPLYNSVLEIVRRYFQKEELTRVMNQMSEEGASFLIEAFENYGQRTLINLGKHDPRFKYAEFRLNDLGLKKLVQERSLYFPQSVFETSKREIAHTIIQGYQEAKSVGEIATDLRGKFKDMQTTRSELIANTELNWATSQGSLQTMVKNGVDKKSWLTVGGGAANGVEEECQIAEDEGPVSVHASFANGLMAPPAHPRCRCRIVEEVDEEWTPPAEIWTGGE